MPSEKEANNCSLHCGDQTSLLLVQSVIKYVAWFVMVIVNKRTAGSNHVRIMSKSVCHE